MEIGRYSEKIDRDYENLLRQKKHIEKKLNKAKGEEKKKLNEDLQETKKKIRKIVRECV